MTKVTVAFRDFANAPKKKDVVGLLGSACNTCVCGATKSGASEPNHLPREFLWRIGASFLCQLQF